ncbi:MAG TPA: molybdenum cofactor guanylyltransferase MobA [Rudaea sp.]|nr:molybdenum cofactor guanylyltransferase MobA [Rudaea sp.]
MPEAGTFDPADITAAILAGGEGSRVGGRDKGLLPLAGEPLIARVCRAMRSQAGALLICANRHHDDYAPYGRIVPDPTAGYRGPLAGIAAALAVCTTPWLLTVPVDCPRPPADLARRLHAGAVGAGKALAVARDGARSQPLFALYRPGLAESARAALSGDVAVWRWQQECDAATVDFPGRAEEFVNLNTLEEFRQWEELHRG